MLLVGMYTDYPLVDVEPFNWKKFTHLWRNNRHKFPVMQAVHDLFRYEANQMKKNKKFQGLYGNVKALVKPFIDISDPAFRILGRFRIPSVIRNWWFNFYLGIVEDLVKTYFNGASMQKVFRCK